MKHHWFIWVPRILTYVYFLILLIFSFHLYGGNQPLIFQNESTTDKLLSIFIFLLLMIGTRKSPIRSGLVAFLTCFLITVIFQTYKDLFYFPILSLPLLIIAIFYIIAHYTNPEIKDPHKSIWVSLFSIGKKKITAKEKKEVNKDTNDSNPDS